MAVVDIPGSGLGATATTFDDPDCVRKAFPVFHEEFGARVAQAGLA